jgi:hypothetical protein
LISKVSDEITTKTVTVTVTDLEEAPTDIQINNAFFIDADIFEKITLGFICCDHTHQT